MTAAAVVGDWRWDRKAVNASHMAKKSAGEQPENEDGYQYGDLVSKDERENDGFFKTWLKIGRDSAMKGIDVGNTAVTEINKTIRESQAAKYEAQVRAAEAEARAKYGAESAHYEAAIANAKLEAQKDAQKAAEEAGDASEDELAALRKELDEAKKAAEEAKQKSDDEADEKGEPKMETWQVTGDDGTTYTYTQLG